MNYAELREQALYKYYSKYAEEVMIDHSFKRSVEM